VGPRASEVPGSNIVDVLIVNVACLASSREAHPQNTTPTPAPPRATIRKVGADIRRELGDEANQCERLQLILRGANVYSSRALSEQ
jgi:hypothetical protein